MAKKRRVRMRVPRAIEELSHSVHEFEQDD
jgi:hypothetical protein